MLINGYKWKNNKRIFIFIKYMKLILRLTCFLSFTFLSNFIDSQYFTGGAIDAINTAKTGSEGDLYLDTINEKYFIGLSNGALTQINLDSSFVQSIFNQSVDSLEGTIFPIWAEESGALTANAFEWSYGNGDESQAAFGVPVPVDCELFAVGVALLNGSAEVEVYNNGVATGATSGVGGVGSTVNTLASTIKFKAGDNVNFRTLGTTGATSGGKVVAWFKILSKTPSFDRLNGSGAPAGGLGNDSDEYLDISNGDFYVKEAGAWVLKLNIIGPAGPATNRPLIQVTNTLSGNINAGNVAFSWINTLATTQVTNNAAAFTVSNTGITPVLTGLYKVTVFQYQTSSANDRNNAALRITVGGVVQNGFGANAYQRRATGHDESTASFSKIINVTGGQEIGIRNDRLAGVGAVTCPANTLVFMVEQL